MKELMLKGAQSIKEVVSGGQSGDEDLPIREERRAETLSEEYLKRQTNLPYFAVVQLCNVFVLLRVAD
mgnify:CR=1 FL=1